MASSVLRPSANQSFSRGTITYTGGSSNYTNLKDSSDASYAYLTGDSNPYAAYPLDDTPANFLAATAVTITIRVAEDGQSLQDVQILKSDGVTAITNTGTAISSSSPTTFNISPSILITDKTSWDGTVLRITSAGVSDNGFFIYEAYVTVTHTTGSGSTTSSFTTFLFSGQL